MNAGRERPGTHRYVGAVIGGALGDALGWPHEQRATALSRSVKLGLQPWVKRSGGRFQPHTESLEAGAYSDDTQLALAVARARLKGGDWWHYLAFSELPFWLVYERGGGGATLRAAKLLSKGLLPWESKQSDRDKYFSAGGNGAAMRSAPHVLISAGSASFGPIAQAVMADGVITHGHPRALVGSLAFAYAVWVALSPRDTLAYGELLHTVVRGVSDWAPAQDLSTIWPSWWEQADRQPGFHEEWDRAVGEVLSGLHVAGRALEDGALSNDDEVLEDLGAFDRKINGAGTVAAVTSIFLASKYAAAPFEGIARAALAKGADTDTIASMTGNLVGSVSGTDWLGQRPARLQDLPYLHDMALALSSRDQTFKNERQSKAFDPRTIIASLEAGKLKLVLPIGQSAQAEVSDHVRSNSPSIEARSWRLTTEVGQTLFVKKLRKERAMGASGTAELLDQGRKVSGAIVATRLIVADLDTSRDIYENALGLKVTSRSEMHIQFGDGFALRKGEASNNSAFRVTLFIGVSNVELSHGYLIQMGLPNIGAITRKSGRSAFAFVDSDGYHLEVFEA